MAEPVRLRDAYQPYWLVFWAATGSVSTLDYMHWNGRQWSAFERAHKLPPHGRSAHADRFLPWLRDRHTDAIGRRVIEGVCPIALASAALDLADPRDAAALSLGRAA